MQWRSAEGGRFVAPLPVIAAIGLVGSCLVGSAAWRQGRPSDPGVWLDHIPVLQRLPDVFERLPTSGGRLGVLALVVAWFGLRRLSVGRAVSPRAVIVVAVVWMLPLLLAPPYFSDDVYSYIAHGRLAERGLDPGEHTPEDLGDDVVLPDVAPGWRVVVTGYGPAATLVSEATARAGGDSIEAAVLLWRLSVLGGVGLLGLGVAALARIYGVDLADALVLAVAGPLTMVHLVGGIHNDALMVGLLACGLAVAARGRGARALVVGAALCGLAAAFKAPALAGAAYIGWTGGKPPLLTPRGARIVVPDRLVERGVRAVATVGVALATVAVVGLVARAGWGWVGGVGVSARALSVLSLSTTVGFLLARLTGAPLVVESTAVRVTRNAFTVAGVAIAAAIMFFTPTLGPAGLAAALAIVAVFGPAVAPWYLTWGLAPAAVALAGRRVWWPMVAAAVAVLAEGTNLGLRPARLGLVTVAVVVGIAAWVWWSRRPAPDPA
jgi:hypothetical protein